jgi:hypothetical protein
MHHRAGGRLKFQTRAPALASNRRKYLSGVSTNQKVKKPSPVFQAAVGGR